MANARSDSSKEQPSHSHTLLPDLTEKAKGRLGDDTTQTLEDTITSDRTRLYSLETRQKAP
jgi:hypothetical protein